MRKRFITWCLISACIMLLLPWLTVAFVKSDAGMAICFILFFAINPLYSVVCGAWAGKDIKQLWALPVITAGLFLTGVWIFFDMGEPLFLLYCGCYLIIGIIAMLIRAYIEKRKR